MNWFCSLLLFFMICTVTSATKKDQRKYMLVCHDGANSTGESFETGYYIPSLGEIGFDNKISSCDFSGVWILYEDRLYDTLSDDVGISFKLGCLSCKLLIYIRLWYFMHMETKFQSICRQPLITKLLH